MALMMKIVAGIVITQKKGNNMIDLNKEAEEYASKLYYPIGDSESELNWVEQNKALIIVGYKEAATNTKYTQAEKIKAQIEENESILKMAVLHMDNRAVLVLETRISFLKEQLNQL